MCNNLLFFLGLCVFLGIEQAKRHAMLGFADNLANQLLLLVVLPTIQVGRTLQAHFTSDGRQASVGSIRRCLLCRLASLSHPGDAAIFFLQTPILPSKARISALKVSSPIAQAVWVFTVSLPLTIVNATPRNPSLGAADYVGWVMWGVGFLFEVFADQQKLNFKKDRANKGRWCDVGVWGYSRHPNYFGEVGRSSELLERCRSVSDFNDFLFPLDGRYSRHPYSSTSWASKEVLRKRACGSLFTSCHFPDGFQRFGLGAP